MSRPPRAFPAVGIIGAGRAGGSLAVLLSHCGWAPRALWSRSHARMRTVARRIHRLTGRAPACRSRPAAVARDTRILLLAVPDDALADMAANLAADCRSLAGCVALHLSGAAGLDPLLPLRARGASTGSLHPLAVLGRESPPPDRLHGAGFAVAGQDPARRVARRMARALGGRPFSVALHRRPLYHLAASLVANDLLAVFHLAHEALCRAGLPAEESHRVLAHLLRGTATSLAHTSIAAALTGPVSRGDAGTLIRHLTAAPDRRTAAAHRLLSQVLVDVARAGGRIDDATARRLQDVLAAAPSPSRDTG